MRGTPRLLGQKRSASQITGDRESCRPRKREKYTRIACESCKTRKVKCSGSLPCSRCSELNAECKYNDYTPQRGQRRGSCATDQHTDSPPANPSKDLSQLLLSMRKICDEIQLSTSRIGDIPRASPSLQRRPSNDDPTLTRPICCTNLVHSLDLARTVLERRGFIFTEQSNGDQSVSMSTVQTAGIAPVILQAARPVLDLGYEKMLKHLEIFQNEIYYQYPCIDMDFARSKTNALFASASVSPDAKDIDLEVDLIDVEIAKAISAIALRLEGGTACPPGFDGEEHQVWVVHSMMEQENAQVEDVIMACLMCILFILKDQTIKAWRMAGFAARTCLEMGVHKNELLVRNNNGPVDIIFIHTLFCCVYDLDRRCSLYADLSWTLQDKDIDEDVFNLDGRHPFLSAMVSVSRLHAEIVDLINTSKPGSGNKATDERFEYLDFRSQQLLDSIPRNDLSTTDSATLESSAKRHTMDTFLRLRATHVRLLTHLRSVNSLGALSDRPRSNRTIISLSISTVHQCLSLTASAGAGGVNKLLRLIVERLLARSVSYLFLMASCNPCEYGPLCRTAFHTALNALNRASYRLRVPHSKVWCSLDDLRRLSEKINMPAPDQSASDASSPTRDSVSARVSDVQQQFADEGSLSIYDAEEHNLLIGLGNMSSIGEVGPVGNMSSFGGFSSLPLDVPDEFSHLDYMAALGQDVHPPQT